MVYQLLFMWFLATMDLHGPWAVAAGSVTASLPGGRYAPVAAAPARRGDPGRDGDSNAGRLRALACAGSRQKLGAGWRRGGAAVLRRGERDDRNGGSSRPADGGRATLC